MKMKLITISLMILILPACGKNECQKNTDQEKTAIRQTAEDITGKTAVDSLIKTKKDIGAIESAQKERLDKAPRPEKR